MYGNLGGSMEEYAIKTISLVKKYKDKVVLNNVSINVKKGEIYGLIGKNGAGKTTLMKVILGIAKQQKGKILINRYIMTGLMMIL